MKAVVAWLFAACALLAVSSSGAAIANDKDSAYTSLKLDQCRQAPTDPDDPLQSGVWWCAGYGGIPVWVAEGDVRFSVSFGAHAAEEPAASQTPAMFNTIGETLEWRLEKDADGTWHPFATILRYFTDAGDGQGRRGQLLVVTKLGGRGAVCQIAIIDVLLNPDANLLARQVADEAAAGFDCAKDEVLRPGVAQE